MGVVNISSQGEWQRILGSSTIVVTDFYADWCRPCKMIAPTFESLATKFSKPGKITFCKVNVDNQQSIAQSHGVSAMPTFLIFKSGSVIETIRGANPPGLTAAVEKAVKLAATAAPGASFGTPGRTLGAGGAGSGSAAPRRTSGQSLSGRLAGFSSFNIINALLTFFGLYFTSLFSFDPYKAAERSEFNLLNPRASAAPAGKSGNRPGGGAAAARATTRARGSCPQCKRHIVRLLERGLVQERQAAPSIFSQRRLSPARVTTRSISTTTSRHQESQPETPPPPPPPPFKSDDIETIVRQARRAFGDNLPKGYLNDEEYEVYERLYGAPIRETRPEDVGMPIPPASEEVDYEYEEFEDDQTVQMRQNEDGTYEEAVQVVNEAEIGVEVEAAAEVEPLESSDEDPGDIIEALPGSEELPSEAGFMYINAVAQSEREFNALLKLQKDFEKASMRPAQEEDGNEEELIEEEEEEEEEDDEDLDEEDNGPDVQLDGPPDRVHKYSQIGIWKTHPSTIQLSKADFVNPIAKLLERTDTTHIKEAAEKTLGGPGLPLSVVTPVTMRNTPQKALPLTASSHKHSQIDADVFLSTMMPGLYASIMSILVQIRKRLGSEWFARLMARGNGEGPRVLDVGAGGAGLAAWERVLQAEWDVSHSQGKKRSLFPPAGKKTVVIGSETLRQRVSRFLYNTTFLPRLPDYLHSGPTSDGKLLDGSEIPAPKKQFDVIIASHLMMPLKDDFRRQEMIDNLWEMLSPEGGVLIILEKAHPRGFEAVADMRSRLLDDFIESPASDPRPDQIEIEGRREREPGRIIAPCTNHKACPMYLNPGTTLGRKDFCHFSQRFIRPSFLQKILGATHQNHDDVTYSFVATTFKGYEDSETAPDPMALPRNVLPPLKRKGHVTMDLCTPAGTLERWTVSRSFSKQAYRDARKAKWGDLWALGAKTRTPRPVRLGKGGPVPDDGGVRARLFKAQGSNPRNVSMAGNKGGIFQASEGKKRRIIERRTKGGRLPPKDKGLLDDLKSE
ncbi:mitochondrial small ribosomal subunit Rsm22-domain-containing protein [Xylariaceae sp. FL0255]|nr:mitochondrial small ribosomal subunit Rsm22-domain-containing protein [Xylariaceae sp. FL0255]